MFELNKDDLSLHLATKALACKLAKAAWHVMAHQVDYDGQKVFGRAADSQTKGLAPANRN